jgi:hypothetical protein
MKISSLALAIVFASMTGTAFAADAEAPAKKAPTAQQKKMAECSALHKGKTGDEYKAGMKACLSEKSEGAPVSAQKLQQDKMKICAAENKSKKGVEYKEAMSACLKG